MGDREYEILKKMADQCDEIIFIFNPGKKCFVYANAAFEAITKRSRSVLFESPVSLLQIVHQEDREYVKDMFRYLLKKTTSSLLDFRIFRPDKTERWIRLKVYPVIDNNEVRYLTGIAEDDSARKAGIFNMQKINGWKDSIFEILAHDLRGPIGMVRTLASAISNKLKGSENKDIHEWAKVIGNISQRNLDLIKTLLTKESLDTVGVEMSKERVDLVWEVNEVMHIYMKSQLKIEKHFEFTHSHEKIFAEIDSMKFLQIINNLISNAIKFTRENGNIKIHIEKLEETVLITVADNGIGIPKSLQPVLFNKYTKAKREGVNGEESVGLGMWIVKSLTEAHGGRVWFESEENEGSKFYVEVPLV